VISSPSTYRDVQRELFAEIHRTAIWPVVVTFDGNIRLPDKTDFIDRDGSYIILIPDRNFKSFEAEINGPAKGRENKFTKVWNSETRFVVAGAINSQCRNKETYLIISQNSEYITALL
jgi:hypothetical protein